MGAEILVLGSSFGGLAAAFQLRKRLSKEHRITVVASDEIFTFIPSLPWVALGWQRPEAIRAPVAKRLAGAGIAFVKDTIKKLEPEANRALGERGTYRYDHLVAATGAELDFAAVPGMGPETGHSHAIFTVGHAAAIKKRLDELIALGGGTIVLGNAPGASCLGPVYEMAFLIDTLLRRRLARPRFRIVLFSNEPYAGHFGVGGFGAMRRMLEDEFADREIECVMNARLTKVMPDAVELDGAAVHTADLSIITPPFYGSHAYMGVDGLANARGFLLADDHLANPRFPNIYAVGVSLAIPPKEQLPIPVGVPKTAQMTEEMAHAAARNIAADIGGGAKERWNDGGVVCIADAGDTAFLVGARPLLPPRQRIIHSKSRAYHYLKKIIERWYMAHVRYGIPMPRISL